MRKADREWARSVYKTFHTWRPGARYEEASFRSWLGWTEEIAVELHPGGRATLWHPSEQLDVEIRWDPSRKSPLFASSFRVSAKGGETLPWMEIQFSHYFAALGLALSQKTHRSRTRAANISKPHAGRPPPINFYRDVIAEYNGLIREGHKHPVAEIARRHDGISPGTVKSWLSRGREYVRREEQR